MTIEDFSTGWTETDPNNHITKTASRCTIAGINFNENASLIRNAAVDFQGDFDISFEIFIDSASDIFENYSPGFPGLSDAGNENSQFCVFMKASETKVRAAIMVFVDNPPEGELVSNSTTLDLDTLYYARWRRDDDASTNGTLYLDIYGSADDRDTNSNAVLSLSMAITIMGKIDLTIISAIDVFDADDTVATFGYLENLDLAYVPPTPPTGGETSHCFLA